MDQSRAPVVEAIRAYRDGHHLSFLPPGHKQGRGVDPRVLAAVGHDVFASDVIMMNGVGRPHDVRAGACRRGES